MFIMSLQHEDNVSKTMGYFVTNIRTFTRPLEESRSYFLDRINKQISSKGAEFGDRWKPRTKMYSWPIMYKTGAMKSSVKGDISNDKTSLKIHSQGNDYFKYHQSALKRKTKPGSTEPILPRRPYFLVDSKASNQVTQFFKKYVEDMMDLSTKGIRYT